MRRRARPLLGTLVEIAIPARCDAEFRALTDAAFDCVALYHGAMSFHEAPSDVSRIGRAEPGSLMEVRPCTAEVLRFAMQLEAASSGCFNVGVADTLQARGRLPQVPGGDLSIYGTSPARSHARPDSHVSLPHEGKTSPFTPRSASACLRFEGESGVHLRVSRRIAIDLGGVAKGAAVDAAVAALAAAGAPFGIVNAGGDLAVFGHVPQSISIRHPSGRGAPIPCGSLQNGAIATTAPPLDGGASPLVAPPGVTVAWADRSVSVIAASCMVADALTKCLAIMGRDASPLLSRYAATGFSVDQQGRVEHVA